MSAGSFAKSGLLVRSQSNQQSPGTKKKKKHKQKVKANKQKKKGKNSEQLEVPVISASDIERYGYCPLSWWLNYLGMKVTNENLERGTDTHRDIVEKVLSVKEKESHSKSSEFNIKIFALVAIMLALNAVAILFPYPYVRNLLIYIAMFWIVIALIYFIYYFMFGIYFKTKSTFQTIKSSLYGLTRTTSTNENSESHRSLLYTSPQTWKRSALWFLIFSGGLAFNGIAFLQPAEPEIMSRIFLISALLWLIGTTAILYIVLRNEEVNRSKMEKLDKETEKKGRYKITKSEKLIIGFAVVATLLAINGLTIQYRETFAQFTSLGQIIMVLAALWLGVSFAFLYLSFRGELVTRTFTKDISSAPSESKKYEIIIEKITSPSFFDKIFSYNWPLLLTFIAIILGINSIIIRYGIEVMNEQSEIFSRFLVIISLLWLLGAFIFLYNALKNAVLAEEIRRLHGIYKGKIEYTDEMDDKSKVLFSEKYNIRGRPDYIVKINEKYIPVELKTGKVPKGPHFSHIIQIAAYCLLVQEKYQIRPSYGIITYGKENKHKITYDEKLENLLKDKLKDMRNCIRVGGAHRNHKRVGKCRYCSRMKNCPESLV